MWMHDNGVMTTQQVKRYAKMPRIGEVVEINVGPITVGHVSVRGTYIEGRDSNGERRTAIRATDGYWLVLA